MRVLICGGGVIGAACAYYLSVRGVDVVLIEKAAIACAASGKSGGFLAEDWCDGTPLETLARRSFALHASLEQILRADYGYRRLEAFAGRLSLADYREFPQDGASWLSGRLRLTGQLSTTHTSAQVHPGDFTSALMQAAISHRAKLHRGEVSGLIIEERTSRITGVVVDGETLNGDAVIIAMGPWSKLPRQWLPLPRVRGLKGHSLVLRTGDSIPPQALFLECREADGRMTSPEVFPRADGTTYVCAISSETPVPPDPAAVIPDAGAIDRLKAICAAISPILAKAPVLAEQACFRPVVADGLPLIGAVPNIGGAYVATGHSVWGILNAPATGEAMAELLTTGKTGVVDLEAFNPDRFGMRSTARSTV